VCRKSPSIRSLAKIYWTAKKARRRADWGRLCRANIDIPSGGRARRTASDIEGAVSLSCPRPHRSRGLDVANRVLYIGTDRGDSSARQLPSIIACRSATPTRRRKILIPRHLMEGHRHRPRRSRQPDVSSTDFGRIGSMPPISTDRTRRNFSTPKAISPGIAYAEI